MRDPWHQRAERHAAIERLMNHVHGVDVLDENAIRRSLRHVSKRDLFDLLDSNVPLKG